MVTAKHAAVAAVFDGEVGAGSLLATVGVLTAQGDELQPEGAAEREGFVNPQPEPVDKKLEGVKAVQTLSRLNRTHPGKDDTFVLDFVNIADDIQESFKRFFEATLAEPTDPNLLYNAQQAVEDFGLIARADVDAFPCSAAVPPRASAPPPWPRLSGEAKPGASTRATTSTSSTKPTASCAAEVPRATDLA